MFTISPKDFNSCISFLLYKIQPDIIVGHNYCQLHTSGNKKIQGAAEIPATLYNGRT